MMMEEKYYHIIITSDKEKVMRSAHYHRRGSRLLFNKIFCTVVKLNYFVRVSISCALKLYPLRTLGCWSEQILGNRKITPKTLKQGARSYWD